MANLPLRKKPARSAPKARYQFERPFTYEFVSTASLAPLTGGLVLPVTTDLESDFFWTKGCVFVDSGNDATTYDAQLCPNLTVQITDGTDNRTMSQVPVHCANYFGTARQPAILPIPMFFAGRALISLLVANVSDNTTYSSIRFSMHGVKRWGKVQS